MRTEIKKVLKDGREKVYQYHRESYSLEKDEWKCLSFPEPEYRTCLSCNRKFFTGGPQWRICPKCKERQCV